MNETHFLQQLEKHLGDMPQAEYHDIIRDFEEHFAMAYNEGKSDEQVTRELGDPKLLAQSLRADHIIDEARERPSWFNLQQAVVAAIGIGVLNFLFVLPVFISLITVIGTFIFTGLVTIGVAWVPFMRVAFVEALFNTVLIFGVGLLLFIFGLYLIKPFYHIFLKYLDWNIKLVKGGNVSS